MKNHYASWVYKHANPKYDYQKGYHYDSCVTDFTLKQFLETLENYKEAHLILWLELDS